MFTDLKCLRWASIYNVLISFWDTFELLSSCQLEVEDPDQINTRTNRPVAIVYAPEILRYSNTFFITLMIYTVLTCIQLLFTCAWVLLEHSGQLASVLATTTMRHSAHIFSIYDRQYVKYLSVSLGYFLCSCVCFPQVSVY